MKIVYCGLIFFSAFAGGALADVKTYTSRAAWAVAVSNPVTINFGTAAPIAPGTYKLYQTPPGLTLSGVSFSSTQSGVPITVSSQAFCCPTYQRGFDQITSNHDGSGIAVTLPAGVTAFGFDLFSVISGNDTGTNQDSIDITVAGQKYVVKTPTAPGTVFFGLVSTSPMSGFTIVPEQTNGQTQADVMNFSFASAAATPSASATVAGVLNAADFSNRLSPGLLVAVYGTNFGTGPASSVTATVGGKSAAVIGVTPNQLTVQLPIDAPTGATSLIVTTGGVSAAPFPVTLDTYAPAVFAADGSGSGPGLIRTASNANATVTSPAKPGDSLTVYVVGLGATNPAVATGGSASGQAPATAVPTLTIGGVNAVIGYAGAAPGLVATYQINFTVPAGLQGTQPVVVSIGGKSSSNAVTLPIFGISSIVSNASFGSVNKMSPGSIASIFANGLGTTDQTVGFPATSFQGVSVLFNGTPAPIFHLVATRGQIDLLVPYELATSGTVTVQVKTATVTSPVFSISMAAANPGLYFVSDPDTKGRLNALAQLNNTAWLIMPDSMAASLKIPGNCSASKYNPGALCGQPATHGDYLVLYVTGMGKATPNGDPNGKQLKSGDVPPANGSVLYQTVQTPTVTVGGLAANVVFSGISPGFPGLYQIDFQVPDGITGDDVAVAVSIGGSAIDTRTIAIR